MKTDIRNIPLAELQSFIKKADEPSYRANQVYEWLWKKAVTSFDQMTNLSKPFRDLLNEHFIIYPVSIDKQLKSHDGTQKYAFKLFDGQLIEGVLIPSESRITACISTQVGCGLGCKFCATAMMKFRRNLNAGEIFDQVVILQAKAKEEFGLNLSNIVIMGMGEPLMNFDNLIFALDRISSPSGLGISLRRITLSTVGIPEGIDKLAELKIKFNLALSLHFADNIKRTEFIPVNKKYDIDSLKKSIKNFYEKTNNRVTIEYLLLNNINDNISDARKLIAFCRDFPVKLNLIEYNKTDYLPFERTTNEKLSFFANFLESKNLVVNIRRSKGNDINAACGQLVIK